MLPSAAAPGRFAGRTCLVTGGGRGIGRAVALALAAEGASVAVVARTASECAEVADLLGEHGLAVPADVTDPGECVDAVAQVTRHFGPLTIVVHAAGISPVRQRAEHHDATAFQQILRVNVGGAFNVAQAAGPALLGAGGSVVFVASVLGMTASPRLAGYGASKAALIHLTRTLAVEWADRGVRVNAVCPGYALTALTEAMLAVDRIRAEISESIPLGRFAELEEIVAPVLFLSSAQATYITGAALAVDGGMAA
jgi:3-oxoacyl-[acyl-carrier protein] reductase